MIRQTMLFASFSASLLLLASCASSKTYVAREDRLQQQIDAIVALDDAMARAKTEQQRNEVRAQQTRTMHDGIQLLRELNFGLIDRNRACIEHESHLPTDVQTCTESQRAAATQTLLMVMLLDQLHQNPSNE